VVLLVRSFHQGRGIDVEVEAWGHVDVALAEPFHVLESMGSEDEEDEEEEAEEEAVDLEVLEVEGGDDDEKWLPSECWRSSPAKFAEGQSSSLALAER